MQMKLAATVPPTVVPEMRPVVSVHKRKPPLTLSTFSSVFWDNKGLFETHLFGISCSRDYNIVIMWL